MESKSLKRTATWQLRFLRSVYCTVGIAIVVGTFTATDVFAQTNYIFMPYIVMLAGEGVSNDTNSPNDTGSSGDTDAPGDASPSDAPCSQGSQRNALLELIISHPNQQRTSLECSSILMQVAQSRANDLATRNYFSHITPEGVGPNYLVMQTGYALPATYSQSSRGNNIESLVAGTFVTSADQALTNLISSTTHRSHILGDTPLFLRQSEIGIGYASSPNSDYTNYWVVFIAEPGTQLRK